MAGQGGGNLLDHEYDGIREYDNPTPGWWHMLFLGTVVFSVVYGAFFHFSKLRWTPYTRLEADKLANDLLKFGEIPDLEADDATILAASQDESWMSIAGSTYQLLCAACHMNDGRGGVGPNLTDRSWLHVERPSDIYEVLRDGVVAKGMPAWSRRMSHKETVLVAAYVAGLSAGDPSSAPDAKAAEGEVIASWE